LLILDDWAKSTAYCIS